MSFTNGDTCKLKQEFDGVAYGPEYLSLKLDELVRFAHTDADDPSWSYGLLLFCSLHGWFPTSHLDLVSQSINSGGTSSSSAIGPTLNNGTSALHTWTPSSPVRRHEECTSQQCPAKSYSAFPPSEDMKHARWNKGNELYIWGHM